MKQISLMLVDDHDVVRTGLRSFLESHSEVRVVAEARNGAEALQRAAAAHPDLVVMDITMPGMDGLEATRRLKAMLPECIVLALTVHEDKQYFMEMLAAGASGYVTKASAVDELMSAIRTVADGHVYLQPSLARWLLEDYQRLAGQAQLHNRPAETVDQPVGLDVLSQREREVLELVGQGWNNQRIGERLQLSPKTIARHRERIMHKLNMHSRTELVKFAIRTGLIDA